MLSTQSRPDIEAIFDKPGMLWTPAERAAVKVWLNEEPQLGQLLWFIEKNLGSGSTKEDARDTWGKFQVEGLDRTIDSYDPARGRRFKPWLLLLLSQFCWREGANIRGRAEVPIEQENPDGERVELQIPDPKGETEQQRVDRLALEQCMNRMPAAYRVVIEMHYFQGMSVREISMALGIGESLVKVRLFRGRRWLRACLQPK